MIVTEFGKTFDEEICLAMGYFDGMHVGHRLLVGKVNKRAKELGIKSAIMTFGDNPNKKSTIYSYHHRKKIFEECGIDLCLSLTYSKVCNMSGKEFFDTLTTKYKINYIICGDNYKFGNDGLTAHALSKLCEAKGIEFFEEPLYIQQGVCVSSTAIKSYLIHGDIHATNRMLMTPYHIVGEVVSGEGIGNRIGKPTANIQKPQNILEIKKGVYGTYTKINDKLYRSVTNYGDCPTFSKSKLTIETHLLNYDSDENLRGKEITIFFYKYIRPIQKFKSASELVARIQKDEKWEDL